MAEKKSSEPPPAPQAPQVYDFFPQVGDELIGTNQHSRFINKKIKGKVLKNLKMREDKFFVFVDTLQRKYIGITRNPEPNQEKLQELTYKILKNNPDAMNIHKFVTIIPEIIAAHKTELTQPNLMNNRAIDGEDYLLHTLRKLSEQEAQKDQDRHNQSPTQEEENEGLQWSMDGLELNGGKKKRKTRRKRKKRKTKKRRKNKRKTKKRRKTKRRKTKRRKK